MQWPLLMRMLTITQQSKIVTHSYAYTQQSNMAATQCNVADEYRLMATCEKDQGQIRSSDIHQFKVMKTAKEARDLIVNSINPTPKLKHIPSFAIEYIWVAIV